MNIIFICDEYPPGKNGGIGTLVRVLGRELVKQGHGVYVTGLYPYSYGGKDYEEDNGVKVWRNRYGLNLGNKYNNLYRVVNRLPRMIRQHLNGKRAFKSYIQLINDLIKTEHIDIIEIPDWNTFAMHIGFKVHWPQFGIPLVLKSHGSYTKVRYDLKLPLNRFFSETDFLLFSRADALSSVSLDTAELNKKIFNLSKPVTILYNGIEIPHEISPVKKREKTIIHTGTLSWQKGAHQLMKAWNLVINKYPDAELIIYGKGKIKPLLKLLSSEATKSVHFNGHVERDLLFRELAAATMAVYPSYAESFALAPMEAMVVGCPVVNTSRSSGKELITDKENGRLINPDDVRSMAAIIIELIEDKAQLAKYSIKGKETILNNFTIAKSAHNHISYYSNIIKNYKPSPDAIT